MRSFIFGCRELDFVKFERECRERDIVTFECREMGFLDPRELGPVDFLPPWSPDGRHLLFTSISQKGPDLWTLPLFGEQQPVPFLQTGFVEGGGRFSPDGRWVAYVSNETGKFEVYVRGFPGAGGKYQISNGGGVQPRWRRDGGELFYVSEEKQLTAVEVSGSSGKFKAGVPRPLFGLRVGDITNDQHYDVTADGQRFLVNMLAEEDAASPVTVVLNFAANLKR